MSTTTKFGSGKDAMAYLFGREAPAGGRQRLDVQIAEALAKPSSSEAPAKSPRTPAKAAKAPKARAPKKARASSVPLTKAQYLASLPPPLDLHGEGAARASREDVVKRIREEIAGAIRVGALPEGARASVTKHHNSINVDLIQWPGQVFVDKYAEHLMDPQGTPWDVDYRTRGDSDKRDWDPRLTDDLNRAAVFLDKLRERHNYDRSDSQSDYFNVGYYGRTSTSPVTAAAEKGIKIEADKDFADLVRRGEAAARAVGLAATKSICGNADLRKADESCLKRLIKVADRAGGKPVEYDGRRRGWFPVEEDTGADKIKLGGTVYKIAGATKRDISLLGPRGGWSSLVQNEKRPELWAHVVFGGTNPKTTWYRRNADDTFTAV